LLAFLCFALAPASFDKSTQATSMQMVWRSEQSEHLNMHFATGRNDISSPVMKACISGCHPYR
jgi:hypothetical protein